MPINSRAKGQRAERAVATALNPILGDVCIRAGIPPLKLHRNLVQTRSGGFDLDGLDWIAIEIKHHQEIKSKINGWWQQTLRQAGPVEDSNGVVKYTREPVLIYKANGSRWHVRMFVRAEIAPGKRLRIPADIAWEDFLVWFEMRAMVEARKIQDFTTGGSDTTIGVAPDFTTPPTSLHGALAPCSEQAPGLFD